MKMAIIILIMFICIVSAGAFVLSRNESVVSFADGIFERELSGIEDLGNEINNTQSEKNLTITYTSTTENTCRGTLCNIAIYSGIRFTDSNGTKIEQAKSLKTCEFCNEIKLSISKDEKYPIEEKDILDYNLTSITLQPKLSVTELNKDIPIEVYSVEKVYDSKTDSFIDNKTTYELTSVNLKTVDEKQTFTLPFGFDKVVKIGENSTEIMLNTTIGGTGGIYTENPNWDLLHDDTDGYSVDTSGYFRAGTGSWLNVYDLYRAFFPLNKTSISGNNVINASLCVYVYSLSNQENDGNDFMVVVGNTSQASTKSLATTDFDNCGKVDNPKEYSFRIDMGNLVTSAYNCFQLTTEGIAILNRTNITLYGLREGHDVLDDPMTLSSPSLYNYMRIEQSPTEPFYNITYETAEVITTFNVSIASSYNTIIFNSTTANDKYLEPKGQNTTDPIINITNIGNTAMDFGIILNSTELNGIELFANSSNNKNHLHINATNDLTYTNIAPGNSLYIWLWTNFTSAPFMQYYLNMTISGSQT